IKFGIPITDYFSTTVRYAPYVQSITLPQQFQDCNNINPDFISTFPTIVTSSGATSFPTTPLPGQVNQNCYVNGEASLAVKRELAAGAVFVSPVGYGFTYNTLDNNRSPTSGLLATFNQDIAGVGGDVNFIKSTIDVKLYNEVLPDLIALLRFQGGWAT